jgi:predicted Zn-ribbon and HTH transcriptional regulator
VFRRDLVTLLLDRSLTVQDLARDLDLRPRELAEDLTHLTRSLRRSPYRLIVTPARCRKCGFRFGEERLLKPGKCPACRGTWMTEPVLRLQRKEQ